jgi:hypothetical protein
MIYDTKYKILMLFKSNKMFLKFYLIFKNLHCDCYLNARIYIIYNISDEKEISFKTYIYIYIFYLDQLFIIPSCKSHGLRNFKYFYTFDVVPSPRKKRKIF